MIDVPKLRGRMAEKGYTQKDVAEMLGIQPNTLRRKLKRGVLGSDEIESLIDILGIGDPVTVFFTHKVT